MKGLLYFILIVILAAGVYSGYTGDLKAWIGDIRRELLGESDSSAESGPGGGTTHKNVPSSSYSKSIENLESEEVEKRISAWKKLSSAYLNRPGQRDFLAQPLEEFVNKYVLSEWRNHDPRVAEIVNVTRNQDLYSIAKSRGTTVEAVKRINGLEGDQIHPGQTLKVLNQPVEIIVVKEEFRTVVLYGGKFLQDMKCGIGQHNRTPECTFTIDVKKKDPPWYRPGGKVIPAGDPANELGSRWLGFKDTEKYRGFGIHEAIGGKGLGEKYSKGCIRLAKRDIQLLYDLVPLGTAVTIRSSYSG